MMEKEDTSEVLTERPQTSPASADPSASGSTTEAESESRLGLFVTLLTVRLLTECHALQNRSQEEWVARTKRLAERTMEGLAVTEGFCPDVKSVKRVCKAVLKDLEKKFCGRRLLESVILLQDPAVDATVVQSLQAHVTELSARPAENASPRSFWKDLLQVAAYAVGLFAAFVIILLIP